MIGAAGKWRSILVSPAFLKPGLKIRQGHIDEVPGGGCRRTVGGCCWGLRGWGDLQWHAGVDPTPAETQVRGRTGRANHNPAPGPPYGLGVALTETAGSWGVARG